MRDIAGYVFLVLFVFAAVAAVLAAVRPQLFARRSASRGVEPPAPGPAPGGAYAPVPDPTYGLASQVAPGVVPVEPSQVAPGVVPVEPSEIAPDAALAEPPQTQAPRRAAVIAVFAAVAVVCAGLTYVLLLMPAYAVTVKPPEQVVAAPGSTITVEVANNGALGGTYRQKPTLDGDAIAEVSGDVAAGDVTAVDVELPDDLAAGPHTLDVGGVQYAFTALTPPEYKVGKLKVEPRVVKPKQEVTVSVKVKNSGEASGLYPGELKAGGKDVGAAGTEIAGGETGWVRVRFTPVKVGALKLDVGGSKSSVMVVKPVRLPNGEVLKNTLAGGGNLLELQNHYEEDAMFCLTSSKAAKKPLLAVYVRGKKNASVSSLRPGTYYVFYSAGKDWNRYTYDFLTSYGRGRFAEPMNLVTRQWTSRSVDYGARMIYTTTYTQSTRFRISIGGGGSGTKAAKVRRGAGRLVPDALTSGRTTNARGRVRHSRTRPRSCIRRRRPAATVSSELRVAEDLAAAEHGHQDLALADRLGSQVRMLRSSTMRSALLPTSIEPVVASR